MKICGYIYLERIYLLRIETSINIKNGIHLNEYSYVPQFHLRFCHCCNNKNNFIGGFFRVNLSFMFRIILNLFLNIVHIVLLCYVELLMFHSFMYPLKINHIVVM